MYSVSSWVKLGRLAVLLACLFFSYSAYAVKPVRFQCGKLDATLISYLKDKYSINSIGAEKNGFAVQVLIDKSGNWVLLGIDENLNVCKLMSGTDWAWMSVRDL